VVVVIDGGDSVDVGSCTGQISESHAETNQKS